MPSLPGSPLPRRRKARPELVIGGIAHRRRRRSASARAPRRRGPPPRARPAGATRRFAPSTVKRSCGRMRMVRSSVAGLAAVSRLAEPAQPDHLAVGDTLRDDDVDLAPGREGDALLRLARDVLEGDVSVASTSSPLRPGAGRPRRRASRKASPNSVREDVLAAAARRPAPAGAGAEAEASSRSPLAAAARRRPVKPSKPWNLGLPSASISPRSNWARFAASPRIS